MNLFKSNIAIGIAAAAAATIFAPVLMPAVAAAGRPLAKSLLKGGIMLYEKSREAVAEAGEALEDLIAEVRAEAEQQAQSMHTAYPESGESASRAETPPGGNGSAKAGPAFDGQDGAQI